MAADTYRFPKCTRITFTPKAVMVKIPEIGDVWIPTAAVHADSDVYASKVAGHGESGTLVTYEWYVSKQAWATRAK
jgi:hypothetical protein